MKKLLMAGACALALTLGGCASGAANADLLKQIDANFQNCERHITFQAGVGVVTPGAQVSGSVDCKGAAGVPTTPPGIP